MNKFFVGFLSLLVGLGLGYLVFQQEATKAPSQDMAGAQVQNDTFNFTGGFTAGSSNQLTVDSSGNLTNSGTLVQSGALTVSNSGNVGATSTTAGGVVTATVRSGAICVANDATATGTISTFASTTGTTLTIKGTPSHLFQYVCF